jgi:hypothetical protein
MKKWSGLVCGTLGLLVAAAPAAAAAEAAAFALIIGVNRGVDADNVPLRYADDDAVRFRTLFSTVGMKTYALARLDENTSRLHPGVERELHLPRLAQLRAVVGRLAADVRAARAAGKKTVLYLAYAGHGKAEGGSGYIMLEDARLRGPDLLSEIIDPVGAGATHVVVDACHSFHAVLGRGAGGSRRPFVGFSQQLSGIAERPDVGLLLSTSSARESHEWAAFQAGVFSHEVRSGLYGAADADGNGLVSYVEIASFVDRANVSVPNEQFRPEVFARPPPAGGATLLDLRPAMGARIEVDGAFRGHHYVEDSTGVRWADFHNGGSVRMVRPSPARLYLRRAAEDREQVLAEGAAVVRTAELPVQDAHVAARGAANDLFRALFALPFTADAIESYRTRDPSPTPDGLVARQQGGEARRLGVVGLGAGGVASAAAGVAVLLNGWSIRKDPASTRSQVETDLTNEKIERRNRWGVALLGVGGAALLGSAALWLLGDRTPLASVDLAVTPLGASAGLRGSF